MDKLDILNRDKFVEQLVRLVENISDNKTSTCFAIDGKWGTGKSFVLRMSQLKRTINSLAWAKTKGVPSCIYQINIVISRTFTISKILFQILGRREMTERQRNHTKKLSLHWKTDWLPQQITVWQPQESMNVYTFHLSRKQNT